jgi:DNA-binding IclR family transcriptional regulator
VLARAYAILDTVSRSPSTVAELSGVLDADSRTVYRITRNLESNGFLRRVPNEPHRFALGFRLLQLGGRASDQLDLREIGHQTLKDVAESTGESALLSVRSGLDIVFAKRVDSQSTLRLSVEEGSRRPLPLGAAGKVLTAYAPADIVAQVLKRPLIRADGVVLIPSDLEAEFAEIRQGGVAMSRSEITLGAGSVAAPIWGGGGEVIAVLSVAGPEGRLLDVHGGRNRELVRAASAKLSAQLAG